MVLNSYLDLAKVIKTPSELDDEIPRQWQTEKYLIAFLDSGKPGYRAAEEMALYDGTSSPALTLSSDSTSDTVTPRRLPSRVALTIPDRHRRTQVVQYLQRRRTRSDSPNAKEHRITLMN